MKTNKKEKAPVKPATAPASSKISTSVPKPQTAQAVTIPASPKPQPTTHKPEISKSKPVVRLELYAPAAQQVFVAGSFNQWHPAETAMQLNASGTWSKELVLGPGRHEYLFLVDGQWLPDPHATQYAPNPFGGQNCLLEIPR